MRVKALQKLYYNRRDIAAGETFDMDNAIHVRILVERGKVEAIEPDEPKQTIISEQAEPIPEKARATPMTTETIEPPVTRRYYRRRDMKAEGE